MSKQEKRKGWEKKRKIGGKGVGEKGKRYDRESETLRVSLSGTLRKVIKFEPKHKSLIYTKKSVQTKDPRVLLGVALMRYGLVY